jgi:lipoate-protein ligase A
LHQLRNALAVKEKDLTAKGIPSVPSEVKNIKSFLNENQLPVYSTEHFIQQIEQLFCKYYHTAEVSTFQTLTVLRFTPLSRPNTFRKNGCIKSNSHFIERLCR